MLTHIHQPALLLPSSHLSPKILQDLSPRYELVVPPRHVPDLTPRSTAEMGLAASRVNEHLARRAGIR